MLVIVLPTSYSGTYCCIRTSYNMSATKKGGAFRLFHSISFVNNESVPPVPGILLCCTGSL